MSFRISGRLVAALLTLPIIAALTIPSAAAAAPKKPNIVLILADDAGYADFGFQGSEVFQTPNIDRIAKNGTRFAQAYVSAAVCGPSRAGLITGKYQQRFGYEENNVPGYMSASGATGDDMGLPLDEKTIADYLKPLGYHSAILGKWHLGNADRFHPLKRGFDEFYGFRGGARSYFPFDESNPNHRREDFLERGFGVFAETPKYFTDALTDEAVAFVERNQDKPFFLYLSYTAVHAPMDALPEDLAAFPQLSGNRQKVAAMTRALDRGVGKLLNTLEKTRLIDNTLVVFTNDNGGPTDHNASNNYPLSGTKATHLEGGIRVPFVTQWPGQIPANQTFAHPSSLLDLLPTFYSAAGGDSSNLKGIDGVNLLPYLTAETTGKPHQSLYWKKENRAAIRDGDWKLLRFPDRPAELYNLVDDASESNNLARQYPEKVTALYQKLFQWELQLDRPKWQLRREFEGQAMKRMDAFRKAKLPEASSNH
ncbi:sulfatase [Microbulbifer sp. Q7]|uniref:sulfatase n=1 Tax=Microbulbifer sp. Q7 TaxID=1785091 RepID=UPI000836B266|nr:sulfatase [Microbulbifer sp. Q7]